MGKEVGGKFKREGTYVKVFYPKGIMIDILSLYAGILSCFSHGRLFAALWTVAHQAPLSMGFSRQEYCNGLPFPSPEDLPNPGIEPGSCTLQADCLLSGPAGKLLMCLGARINITLCSLKTSEMKVVTGCW